MDQESRTTSGSFRALEERKMINILGKRYYYFALSMLLIIPGLIILAVNGLPLAIDFKGGTLLELQFPTTNLPETTEVIALYNEMGFEEVQVQTDRKSTRLNSTH